MQTTTNEMRDFEEFLRLRKIRKIKSYIEKKGDRIETKIYFALQGELKRLGRK